MSAATDLAEHLVRAGHAVPRGARGRRRARAAVGRARRAARRARARPTPPRARRRSRCSSRARRCARRTTPGGAGPEPVAAQLDAGRVTGSTSSARWLDAEPHAAALVLRPRRARARAASCSTRCSCRASRRRVLAARIVEVEAYRGADDPGQPRVPRPDAAQRDDVRPARAPLRVLHLRHALVHERGVRPGTTPHAVLLRAAAPLAGLDVDARAARRRRGATATSAPGPGRLGQAFGVDRALDGVDLVRGPIRIVDDGTPPPDAPRRLVAHRPRRGKGEASAVPVLRARSTRT